MGIQDRDWYWEDREARERLLPAKPRVEVDLFWEIVGGVFLGSLLAAIVFFGYQEFRVQQELAAVASRAKQELAVIAAQQARQRQAEARLAQARQAEEDQRRADEASERAVAEEAAAAKAAAWKKFYKRPAACETNADVECANHFIRSKRAFEAQWALEAPVAIPQQRVIRAGGAFPAPWTSWSLTH